MNKLFLAGAAIAALTVAAPANAAADQTYVGVGVTQTEVAVEGFDLDNGSAFDLTVGTDVIGGIRVEGRVARGENDTNLFGLPLNVESTQYAADAFLDLDVGMGVTPYVGGGVTYTDANVGMFGTEVDARGWGWEAAAGVRAPINETVTFDGRFTYGESTLDVAGFGDVGVEQSAIRLGVDFAL